MTDRAFWLAVRRALLMICRAIESRWLLSDDAPDAFSD